jgi:hypothetical protein
MGSEALWELVKVFLAALLASTLTHLLTHRRFIQGRWWDRKNKAYGDIIGSLVGLIRSLEWQRDVEERYATRPGYEPSEERLKAVRDEYKEGRDQIERAAIEGGYVVTRKAANALAELVEALRVGPGITTDWWGWFDSCCGKAESCLEIVRAEARSDLRVKWYSL